MREDELLNIKNFGRKSLDELQEKLDESELRRPRGEGEGARDYVAYDDDEDDEFEEDGEDEEGDEEEAEQAEEAEATSMRDERES
jgi:hypothetical protein